MKNTELEQLINEKLNSAAISDYAPNVRSRKGIKTDAGRFFAGNVL